ncbi:DsbC family protein [Chitinimonas sp. BJYL2]|uniref:DsbC family protein n=1 Tax=Chitinimonas sp. BJYL2 TaxID=2976696 RepID=UPI0022B2EDB5|nr:DsbC family protein [Chitinimonas sp. BJYL2]
MMSLPKRLSLMSIALMLAACVNAASDNNKATKDALQKKFPERTIESVRATPIKGLYEVVFAGRQVVYSDPKGDYIVVGDLVDVAARQSLTEARIRELSKVDFKTLPLDKAIKLVKGNGSRKVAVFSDPDCPFCKRLETDTISKLDNVTVYTFMLPLASLHPDAARKSALIWCAPDKLAAWNAWMLEGRLPQGDGKCANPVNDIVAMAERYGINGTPALVFESGEMVSGAIAAPAFEAHLNKK